MEVRKRTFRCIISSAFSASACCVKETNACSLLVPSFSRPNCGSPRYRSRGSRGPGNVWTTEHAFDEFMRS